MSVQYLHEECRRLDLTTGAIRARAMVKKFTGIAVFAGMLGVAICGLSLSPVF